jgi:hypothetical protein
VKAIKFQPTGCQKFRIRSMTRTAEGTGGAKAGVVNQDDENVWGTRGWAQLSDWRELGIRIFGIVGDEADSWLIRDGKNGSLNLILAIHTRTSFLRALNCWDEDEEKEAYLSRFHHTLEGRPRLGNCQNVQSCGLGVMLVSRRHDAFMWGTRGGLEKWLDG